MYHHDKRHICTAKLHVSQLKYIVKRMIISLLRIKTVNKYKKEQFTIRPCWFGILVHITCIFDLPSFYKINVRSNRFAFTNSNILHKGHGRKWYHIGLLFVVIVRANGRLEIPRTITLTFTLPDIDIVIFIA